VQSNNEQRTAIRQKNGEKILKSSMKGSKSVYLGGGAKHNNMTFE